jgi:hypothetical protein
MPELVGPRIELQTHDSEAAFALDATFYAQDYYTFQVSASSGGFRGRAHFCVAAWDIRKFIESLRSMLSTLSGTATLIDSDSDAFVEMTVDDSGQVMVRGRVGGTHQEHTMTFEFRTDQTCIGPLITELDCLLESN